MGSICSTGCRLQISHVSYETVKSISDIRAYVLWLGKLKREKGNNYRTCIYRCYLIYSLQILLELCIILFSPFFTRGKESSVTFWIQNREWSTALVWSQSSLCFPFQSHASGNFSLERSNRSFRVERFWAFIVRISLLSDSRGIIPIVLCVTIPFWVHRI